MASLFNPSVLDLSMFREYGTKLRLITELQSGYTFFFYKKPGQRETVIIFSPIRFAQDRGPGRERFTPPPLPP